MSQMNEFQATSGGGGENWNGGEPPGKGKASSYLNDPSRSMLAWEGANASGPPAHTTAGSASEGAERQN